MWVTALGGAGGGRYRRHRVDNIPFEYSERPTKGFSALKCRRWDNLWCRDVASLSGQARLFSRAVNRAPINWLDILGFKNPRQRDENGREPLTELKLRFVKIIEIQGKIFINSFWVRVSDWSLFEGKILEGTWDVSVWLPSRRPRPCPSLDRLNHFGHGGKIFTKKEECGVRVRPFERHRRQKANLEREILTNFEHGPLAKEFGA